MSAARGEAALPVRAGEELDVARLAPWLREVTKEREGAVRVLQFPGGHSNLTYLVTVGTRELVLRRPPFGSTVKTAHDMAREHRILSALSPILQAPRPLAMCDDLSILGCPFYAMERIPGIVLRRDPPSELPLDATTARRLCETFVDTLGALHSLDVAAAGLSDFGHPEGYVSRQVSGWTQRCQGSRTDDIPDMEDVSRWLDLHQPTESGVSVIHNDYKLDNLVLDLEDPSHIVGILDWEMATVGDPLMDLGSALCYWVQADDAEELRRTRFGPTNLPGMMTRAEIVDRYFSRCGRDPVAMTFFYVFGLFKTAVVAQQIYYRYRQGLTQDTRFASFLDAVRVLARQAARIIENSAILGAEL